MGVLRKPKQRSLMKDFKAEEEASLLRKQAKKTHKKRLEYNAQADFGITLRDLQSKNQKEIDRHDWRKRDGTYPFQCRDRFEDRKNPAFGENPPIGAYDPPQPRIGENVHTYSNLDGWPPSPAQRTTTRLTPMSPPGTPPTVLSARRSPRTWRTRKRRLAQHLRSRRRRLSRPVRVPSARYALRSSTQGSHASSRNSRAS